MYNAFRVSKNVKVCILGYSNVGKTGLLIRYVKGLFNEHSEVTVGLSFSTKHVKIGEYDLKLQIWDTAGQEIYQSLTRNYYRGAEIVILVYDITCLQNFEELQVFVEELRHYDISNAVLALVGNKNDLDNSREVSFEMGQKYAESIGAVFLETSAKTGANIDLLFEQVVEKYVEKMSGQENENDVKTSHNDTITIVEAKEKKKGCCSK